MKDNNIYRFDSGNHTIKVNTTKLHNTNIISIFAGYATKYFEYMEDAKRYVRYWVFRNDIKQKSSTHFEYLRALSFVENQLELIEGDNFDS